MRHLISAATVAASTASVFAQASFSWFGPPDADGSGITGISNDGRTLMGRYYSATGAPNDIVCVDGLCASFEGEGKAMSGDGRTVAGLPYSPNSNFPAYWRDLVQQPPIVPSGNFTGGSAVGISADASTIIGNVADLDQQIRGYVWSQGAGFALLPALDREVAWPDAVSSSGRVIIGRSHTPARPDLATRWIDGAPELITTPAASLSSPRYRAMSSDGVVLAGEAQSGDLQVAIRLTGGGVRIVAVNGSARAISSDGWVIVGGRGYDGFIWDPIRGTRTFRSYMASLGAPPPPVYILTPAGISGDGGTVTGYGSDLGEPSRGFIARIPKFCYPNCDASTSPPLLNVLDFNCYLNKFTAGVGGDPAGAVYANCDNSSAAPVLNVLDFNCFLNKFTAGCP